jgi:hypothetical protein
MRKYDKFYINGQWVEPIGKGTSEVINPATVIRIMKRRLAVTRSPATAGSLVLKDYTNIVS